MSKCNLLSYRKARVSSDSNFDTKINKYFFFQGLSHDLWCDRHTPQRPGGQRTHEHTESLFSFSAAYHQRGCFIYESNHAFYVTPRRVALFGKTREQAIPFRVVFNEVQLWSKPKIICLWKVCGEANKLYSSIFGTSDKRRLSDQSSM